MTNFYSNIFLFLFLCVRRAMVVPLVQSIRDLGLSEKKVLHLSLFKKMLETLAANKG